MADMSDEKVEIMGDCIIPDCEGKIVERTWFVKEYNPTTGPPVWGPAGASQYVRVKHSSGLYCDKCGVKYQFVPEKSQKSPAIGKD